MTTMDQLREQVRRRYADAALAVEEGTSGGCCGSDGCCDTGAAGFGESLYAAEERGDLPDDAVLASLGCGNPVAVAELSEGETVLDLGSGGGIDVILSAKRVGPTGRVGLDMTEEMLALARRNAREAGVANAIFLRGVIEDIPLPAGSVDVVISNCVVNLSTDKAAVFAELGRVVTPGGRVGITDVVAEDRPHPPSGPSGARTSAASPVRSRKASTRRRSGQRASTRCRSSSRTRSPTACTRRSSRRPGPRTEARAQPPALAPSRRSRRGGGEPLPRAFRQGREAPSRRSACPGCTGTRLRSPS